MQHNNYSHYSTNIKSVTNIVLCTDSNYLIPAIVCMQSIKKNSITPIKFFIITPSDFQDDNGILLNFLNKWQLNFELIRADTNIFFGWQETNHINNTAYLRLLIPDLIFVNRVIYLDCDILVQADLGSLFNIDLLDFYAAGVRDYSEGSDGKFPLNSNDIYINSGVLLLDLDALRKFNFFSRCLQLQQYVHQKSRFVDQCIINKALENKKLILTDDWNFQIQNMDLNLQNLKNIQSHAKIIHFIGKIKPWSNNANPLSRLLWIKLFYSAKVEGKLTGSVSLLHLIKLILSVLKPWSSKLRSLDKDGNVAFLRYSDIRK